MRERELLHTRVREDLFIFYAHTLVNKITIQNSRITFSRHTPEPLLLVRTNSKAPLLGTFKLNVTSILGHRDLNASLSSTARRR
jgi:hypothetical protein